MSSSSTRWAMRPPCSWPRWNSTTAPLRRRRRRPASGDRRARRRHGCVKRALRRGARLAARRPAMSGQHHGCPQARPAADLRRWPRQSGADAVDDGDQRQQRQDREDDGAIAGGQEPTAISTATTPSAKRAVALAERSGIVAADAGRRAPSTPANSTSDRATIAKATTPQARSGTSGEGQDQRAGRRRRRRARSDTCRASTPGRARAPACRRWRSAPCAGTAPAAAAGRRRRSAKNATSSRGADRQHGCRNGHLVGRHARHRPAARPAAAASPETPA